MAEIIYEQPTGKGRKLKRRVLSALPMYHPDDQHQARLVLTSRLLLERTDPKEMAKQTGVTLPTVYDDIREVRQQWASYTQRSYGDYVAEELERLAGMELALLPRLQEGDTWAIDRALKLMELRMRLMGFEDKVDARGLVMERVQELKSRGELPEGITDHDVFRAVAELRSLQAKK